MPTYRVLTPLQHNGKRYEHGELVTMDEVTTEILIEKKVIEFVPDKPSLPVENKQLKPPEVTNKPASKDKSTPEPKPESQPTT